jgi:hypothetical protein
MASGPTDTTFYSVSVDLYSLRQRAAQFDANDELAEKLPEDVESPPASPGLDCSALVDAVDVAAEGRAIAEAGVPWVVDGIIPQYGMLGMLVAYAKVGKTTFSQALGGAVSKGEPFLGRPTATTKVLVVAAEDPPEYTAYIARHLDPAPGRMVFYRGSLILDVEGLQRLAVTIRMGGFGLVLLSSWQSLIRGLIRDENDNAGAVRIVENVKAVVRETGVPWLIDAHSGKGENQADEADPSKAQRGASGAAGAADFTLSLRYANGAFDPHRRLSGKGRFVMLAPETLTFDDATGSYDSLGDTKNAARETTWRQIAETGALCDKPRTAATIARAAGIAPAEGKLSGSALRRVHEALHDRPSVLKIEMSIRGGKRVHYHLAPDMERGAS